MARVLSTCVGWALLVLLSSALPSLADPVRGRAGEAPDVTIAQGVVKGIEATSLRGRNFYSYRGIPYAKAPIGDLRFRAPAPLEAGSDVIDATKDGPVCMQKTPFYIRPPLLQRSEDCLTINVYTPQSGAAGLPVMVYIHGGGFISGGGISTLFGPEYLLDKDIVLVTFNYRLGVLGFLSTGDSVAPGNYGFKDQVAALKWVRDNIAAFGGNPGSVTLFGESAGSASVHYHLLSNQSQGLFHRAISQSGTAISSWAWPSPNPNRISQEQSSHFNCSTADSQQMIDCLRKVDALTLVNASDSISFGTVKFGPVVEDPLTQDSFLTAHPLELLRAGKINKVPWMVGVVAQEGIIGGQPILANKTLLNEVNANLPTIGPLFLQLAKSIDDGKVIQDVWKNITTFYFNDQLPITEENGNKLIDLFSDRSFMHSAHKSALLHADHGHDSVYMYNFNYRGANSYGDFFGNSPTHRGGVCHGDDLIYLLKQTGLFPDWPKKHPDLKMIDSLVTLWTNFVIHGKPASSKDSPSSHVTCDLASTETDNRCDLSHLSWTPVSVSSPLRTSYLNIYASNNDTLDFAMEQDFYKERMAFWDQSPLKENL